MVSGRKEPTMANTYPLTERTYFSTEDHAWRFAQSISPLKHYIVSDYGRDDANIDEPYWVETVNDPFRTKDELMRLKGFAL